MSAPPRSLYLTEDAISWDNPLSVFRHWLMHSYVYYVQHTSIIPDEVYDRLCLVLLGFIEAGWEPPNKGYATLDALRAGTGFHIPGNLYPGPAISVAENALRQRGYTPVPHLYEGSYDDRGMAFLPNQ